MKHWIVTALLSGAALPALAQQPAPPAPDAAPAEAEPGEQTIVVTGSRVGGRTAIESPVPVDVISGVSLRQTGMIETTRALRDLVPSFNFPQPAITDGTDVVRPATLRGLGPDQTLVLINGRRRHTSALLNINGSVGRGTAAVDINHIPTVALERVEVLRDGAAAIYGSDAIAGVINFQLSRAREGGFITATYGEFLTNIRGVERVTGIATPPGAAPVLAPDGTLVLTDTGRELQVNDGDTFQIAGNIGLPLGAEGFINLSAEYRNRGRTNRTGYDPRRQFNLVSGALDPREFVFQRRSHRYGDPDVEDVNVFVNAGAPLGAVEAYFTGSYGYRDGRSGGFYRLPNDARNVPEIYPFGFLPLINSKIHDFELVGGLRGEVGGWDWDLSASFGRNQFDFRVTDSVNRSLGTASPTEFDSGGIRYSQTLINLDFRRAYEIGFLERFGVAAGAEYRRETYQIRPGEPASFISGPAGGAPGAQVFPGFQPVIGGQRVDIGRARDNFSGYVELDADIVRGWNLQVAGRYESYSDFGDTINGKAATRVELTPWVAVRGAISTGFRAPSLQQQFFAAQATNNVGGVLLEALTLPVSNPVAQVLGSQPLRAETSVSYSAGVTLEPARGLTATVDFYQIDIDDRIVVTENLQGAAVLALLARNGFPFVNTARFFINGVDTRTRGVDVVGAYAFDVGETKLRLTAGYNYNENRITGRVATLGPLAQIPGLVLFGRQESLRLERGQPQDRINLGADADYRWAGLTVRANRFGRVLGAGVDQFTDVVINPAWVMDLELRFKPVGTQFEIALGSNNLLDQYPDPVPTGRGVDPVTNLPRNFPATNYVANFSAFSPFGFNGRFLYLRTSMRF